MVEVTGYVHAMFYEAGCLKITIFLKPSPGHRQLYTNYANLCKLMLQTNFDMAGKLTSYERLNINLCKTKECTYF